MNKEQINNLIHNLRLLRTAKNKSATQLTLELNLNGARTITDIENSTTRKVAIKPEEIAEIATYFNIDVDTLLNKKAYVVFK
jgi:transcriptional regulator with XRE-family HTH domain